MGTRPVISSLTKLFNRVQMDDTINYLAANNVRLLKKGETVESARNGTNVGATVGMLWLDIEGTDVSAIFFYDSAYCAVEILCTSTSLHTVLVLLRAEQRELPAGHGGRGQRTRRRYG
jgi:hypothetical protein